MYSFRHVALSVANIETSISFYKLLGFTKLRDWTADDGSLTITHLKNGDMILELFRYTHHQPAPASTHSTSTDLPVIGTKHFGLGVESIQAARADLTSKGLGDKLTETKRARTASMSYFFVADPDGILVEIWGDEA
jgi:glyoxylase I family protein